MEKLNNVSVKTSVNNGLDLSFDFGSTEKSIGIRMEKGDSVELVAEMLRYVAKCIDVEIEKKKLSALKANSCNDVSESEIIESKCRCGQDVLISLSGNSGRKDGKRIFYPDEPDEGWTALRCKSCLSLVSESVPGAEYA